MRRNLLFKKLLKAVMILLIGINCMPNINAQTLIAAYPLTSNLNDSTGNYAVMTINGGSYSCCEFCMNGNPNYSGTNPYAYTPNISTIVDTNFEIDVEYQPNAFIAAGKVGNDIITGGYDTRWIGIATDSNGYLGYSYNNCNYVISNTQLTIGTWYTVKLQYFNGRIRLLVNGNVAVDECCPKLVNWSDYDFSTLCGGDGRALNGCIKELKIYNNPVLPMSSGGSLSGGSSPICLGASTGTLTLTGNTGNIIKWQKSLNSGAWTDISNITSTYSEIPSSAGTWFYRVNSGGCPTVYSDTVTVIVKPVSTGDTTAIACDSLKWHGIYYTSTSTPSHIFTNSVGCDSTVTLHLTVNYSTTGDTTVATCNTFTWYGNIYNTTGTHTHLFTNKAGCDSTVTLHLTINYTPSTPVASATAQPTCADSTGMITVTSPTGTGMTYSIDGITYTNTTGVFTNVAPGNYHVTANSGGCKSSQSSLITINAFTETLAITYPHSGVTLYKGLTDTIKWSTNCIGGKVKIALCKGLTNVLQLAIDTPNTEVFPINPPLSLINGSNYRIAISDTANKVLDTSAYFNIASTYAEIMFSGDAVNGFGYVQDSTIVEKTLTINNIGNKILSITSISYPTCLTDSFYGNWAGGNINAGSNHDITVSCKPKQPIPFSGWIKTISNSINVKDSVIITVTGSGAGIIDVNNDNVFKVYPNPTSENITIENISQTQAIIEISNLQGQLIKTFTTNSNKTNVDISAFPCGMYFISMKTEKGIAVEKFVKE
ncbi:MAG: T9SS type A sorting domain-containing protein [Bacteroidales bacterium]